ncbi:MAG: hypothetical protein KBT27_09360 [Prevotellaceae bacterium]|nr:hypothetical protein [Candidatus Faecinaster equi]
MSLIKNVLVFGAGVTIGAGAMYAYQYKKMLRSIRSIEDYYKSKNVDEIEATETVEEPIIVIHKDDDISQSTVKDYNKIVESNDYAPRVTVQPVRTQGPRIISPEKFEHGVFDKATVLYFSNGVYTCDGVVWSDDEVDEFIGIDAYTHFGEYEKDSVFVRNDRQETDYEILFVDETYGE